MLTPEQQQQFGQREEGLVVMETIFHGYVNGVGWAFVLAPWWFAVGTVGGMIGGLVTGNLAVFLVCGLASWWLISLGLRMWPRRGVAQPPVSADIASATPPPARPQQDDVDWERYWEAQRNPQPRRRR